MDFETSGRANSPRAAVGPDPEIKMRHFSLNAALLLAASFALTSLPAVAQDIGVASCDSFLTTYKSCVSAKLPADQQATVGATLEQTRANWKAVAATPEGKAKLDATCKETTEQMKKQLAALNCAW